MHKKISFVSKEKYDPPTTAVEDNSQQNLKQFFKMLVY